MNRFLYYLIYITMITNIIASVPKILVNHSNGGVVVSIIIAVFVGLILLRIVVSLFNHFPGESYLDLMKKYYAKWFYVPVLLYFAISWFVAGLITLVTYVFLFKTFFSFETSIVTTTLAFLLIISFGVLMKSESVLNTIEIVFLLLLPVILFMLIKVVGDKRLEWDYVKVALTYVNHLPDYSAVTASCYIFIGAVNIILFNKYFKEKQKVGFKQLSIIGLVGTVVLFITYLIPIGFHGFDGINTLTFPWVSTSDAVRMKYGIIERVVFIFIIVFLGIAYMSLLVHWHVSVKIFESVFTIKKLAWKNNNLTPHLYMLLFGIAALIIMNTINEYELFEISKVFFNTLPVFYAVLIFTLLLLKRRAKN